MFRNVMYGLIMDNFRLPVRYSGCSFTGIRQGFFVLSPSGIFATCTWSEQLYCTTNHCSPLSVTVERNWMFQFTLRLTSSGVLLQRYDHQSRPFHQFKPTLLKMISYREVHASSFFQSIFRKIDDLAVTHPRDPQLTLKIYGTECTTPIFQ